MAGDEKDELHCTRALWRTYSWDWVLSFKQRYGTILLMTTLSDTLDNRLEIFDLMAEVHQNGYHHFDLIKGNVCFKDGKFRLIDLEDAHRHIDISGRRTTCT